MLSNSARNLAVSLMLVATAACATSQADVEASMPASHTAVYSEFGSACGLPGSVVYPERDRGTIRRGDCDLTGVTLAREGYGGAVVPDPGEGVANSLGLVITTSVEGDVTYSWELAGLQ